MSKVYVSPEPTIFKSELGINAGHKVTANNKNFIVVPTLKHIHIFKIGNKSMTRIKKIKVTDQVMEVTETQEGFVDYIRGLEVWK